MSFTQKGIQCCRTAVLVLSVSIVTCSLSIYSSYTVPVFSLFQQQSSQLDRIVLLEMVQDRRLISTLVAAQASVFCPMFLILTSHQRRSDNDHQPTPAHTPSTSTSTPATTTDTTLGSIVLELFCRLLMPLGLSVSWLFCILFDRKTMAALVTNEQSTTSLWWPLQDLCLFESGDSTSPCLVINMVHTLKYCVVGFLICEISFVLAAFFWRVYHYYYHILRHGSIRLSDDEKSFA
ncbi:hypothetical protein BCR43DRAFT_490348 [Syncephalastrum racemosum]|uniref:Uncharacterized protein n=1 Tax=Syncephalastrum racemosum TaxID=13706 RepID=A0A1X2HFV3_SYNRA|nr:hypothetical protein BCR43DRAFT_490348 [Syncephalastrum racemosum]